MDRGEDVEPNPVNGKVYAALTNNSNRGSTANPVNEANPLGRLDGAVRHSMGRSPRRPATATATCWS